MSAVPKKGSEVDPPLQGFGLRSLYRLTRRVSSARFATLVGAASLLASAVAMPTASATDNPDLAAPANNYPTASAAATRTIIYRRVANQELRLHIWDPPQPSATPRPAVLFFHGGGFTGGSPHGYRGQCDTLAKLGIVGISAEYRLLDPHSVARELHLSISDAQAAYRFVSQYDTKLNVDPKRIALGGGSAGGYLALAATVLPHREAPDWTLRPALLLLYNPGLGSGGHALLPHVRGPLPPTLVLHGDQDTTVPLASSEALAERWRAAGGEIALSVYHGQKHAFFNYSVSRNKYHRTLREMIGFLALHGWMPGPE